MLTLLLRSVGFLVLVTAVAVATSSPSQAIGSFQTKPAFPDQVRTDDPPVPPRATWPNMSATNFVGGCGMGRVSDNQTHGCHGPADIK
jgi:hypothetical protein